MGNTPTPRTMFVRRPLNIGDVLHLVEIVAVLVTVIGGWYQMSYRVSKLEDTATEQTPILKRIADGLDKLDDQLLEYPPHRHTSDGGIEFPAGTVPPVEQHRQR